MLILTLLPALLFGPVLDGATAWLHSHGPDGGHLHVLESHGDAHDHLAVHAWHGEQHRHGHPGGHDEDHTDHGTTPDGLQIELPELLTGSPRTPTPAGGLALLAARPSTLLRVTCPEARGRDPSRSGWPPQPAMRSGVPRLLRSSHAILI